MYASRKGEALRRRLRLPPTRRASSPRSVRPISSRLKTHAFMPPIEGGSPSQIYASHLTEYEKSEINSYDDVFYAGQNCDSKIPAPVDNGINHGFDDERGDYIIKLHDHIAYRYEILGMLGSGSFGQVVKVMDHQSGNLMALKIIRNKKRFAQQAKIETQILSQLRRNDPEGRYGIVQMYDNFNFRSHACSTFELLSISLYEYIKQRNFYPLPLNIVRKIAAGVLVSLSYLWKENIVHCDLKPENILLKAPDRSAVKVIDLGSACYENSRLYTYIQSRFYRAPEVILGIPYTRRIDLWSYGCVLCELATGYPLFPGESEREQLACIMEYLGPPPREFIVQSPRKNDYFDVSASYAPKLVANSRRRVRYPGTKALSTFLGLPEENEFVSFIRMFIRWTPEERTAPKRAMRHRWIAEAFENVGGQATAQHEGNMPQRGSPARLSGEAGMSNLHLPKIGTH